MEIHTFLEWLEMKWPRLMFLNSQITDSKAGCEWEEGEVEAGLAYNKIGSPLGLNLLREHVEQLQSSVELFMDNLETAWPVLLEGLLSFQCHLLQSLVSLPTGTSTRTLVLSVKSQRFESEYKGSFTLIV